MSRPVGTALGVALGIAFAASLAGSAAVPAAGASAPLVEAGQRMYRGGILPSGEPMEALVAGDVPVLGSQFSCRSCHGRSGMGSAEGAYIVPPVAGRFLFAPSPQPQRPAYTLESFAAVLRDGVTPAGRTLDAGLMPRYRLDDEAVATLAAYLETLSAGDSPGVDDSTIRFAAVFTGDETAAERAAVLAVLRQFFEEKNRETRNDSERWDRGYTPESQLPTLFREWILDEWTLAGPPATWAGQLEERYRSAPVFAMLSGTGSGGWGPVSRFCERHEVPCLFPSTSMPEPEEGDYYTLYFSRGLALEAALIAGDLAREPPARLVQLYCDEQGAWAAATLQKALADAGQASEDLAFPCAGGLPLADLAARMAMPGSAAVLWIDRGPLAGVGEPLPAGRLYLSSTLLGTEAVAGLADAPGPLFLAHPYLKPGAPDPAMRRFLAWARTRKIELTAPRQQAEAFFACLTVKNAVGHMRRFFVRDYALDKLDHAQGLLGYLPYYPRPTIGPQQRFLTKGGYLLPVIAGQVESADAEWIIP